MKISLKKLEEIAEVYNGVRENRYEKGETTKQPVFQLERPTFELFVDFINLSENIDDKYYSKKGDIIINIAYPYQIFLIEREGIIITSKFAIIRLKEGYDSNYIYQLLESKKRILSRVSEGFALKFLKVSDLKTIRFDLPNFDDQKKHGELLNFIDKKIKIQEQMIEEENKFKKIILGESNVKL